MAVINLRHNYTIDVGDRHETKTDCLKYSGKMLDMKINLR
jgi:hypothetical protein